MKLEQNITEKTIQYSPEELDKWNTGSVYLKHIQETISLNPRMRVMFSKDKVEGNWCSQVRISNIDKILSKNDYIDFIIDYYGGKDIHYVFVRGHEEGHLADLTGNLKKLWETSKNLGYEFNFFTKKYAEQSDEIVTKLCNADYPSIHTQKFEKDMKITWIKDYDIKETIANIGGLITLKKLNVDSDLLQKIEQGICTGYPSEVFCIEELSEYII